MFDGVNFVISDPSIAVNDLLKMIILIRGFHVFTMVKSILVMECGLIVLSLTLIAC